MRKESTHTNWCCNHFAIPQIKIKAFFKLDVKDQIKIDWSYLGVSCRSAIRHSLNGEIIIK